MKLLDLKLRMIVLWIWIPVAMSGAALFYISEPGKLEEIITEMQTMRVWYTIIGAIPWLGSLVMAFLSIALKERANRITNRVLSIILTALLLVELVEVFLEPLIHQILFHGSMVVAAAYILFYSWKWPVKEA